MTRSDRPTNKYECEFHAIEIGLDCLNIARDVVPRHETLDLRSDAGCGRVALVMARHGHRQRETEFRSAEEY